MILDRMKNSYIEYAGFTPQEQSDVMLRLRVLAGEIYKEQAYADYVLRQMFPSTAVGEYLDMHAAQRGLTRKPATKAHGSVAFFPAEETHDDILIPAGTVVCTYNDLHRYTTDSDVILRAEDSRAIAQITAVEEGAAYNAIVGVVTIIVTPVIGIGRVFNGSYVIGGSDVESDEDLRARLQDSIVNISNGTNAAYYKKIAMSVSGVSSASVVGRARGAGTVDVYILGDGVRATSSILAQVQELLTQGRELNVDVRACHPQEIDVSLYIRLSVEAGYDFDTVAEEVRQTVTDFINTLGVGRDVLLSEIGEVIYHIKGVSDYKFLESYGSDVMISDSQYACADNIIVREV